MFGLFRLLGLAALWEFFKRGETGRRIGRAAVGVGAALIALTLFFVISRFLVTIDDIESQTIRWVYAALVAVIFGGLALFLYLFLRAPRTPDPKPKALRPPSADRLQALYRKHNLTAASGDVAAEGSRRRVAAPAVAVTGVAGGGKSELFAALSRAYAPGVIELPALSVWAAENTDTAEMAAGAKKAVLVADQDLRKYEVEFIDAVQAYGRNVIVAVDKSDRLTATDRAEIAASIAAKFAHAKRKPEVAFVASAPLPVNAVVVGADGSEREETRTRRPDIAALLEKL
ncbi:MAG: hypothetical protein NW215_02260 [Hyphomicrobiales bacterium]|nr:hypothetical protein [Hyphomicrobiales bacterium]